MRAGSATSGTPCSAASDSVLSPARAGSASQAVDRRVSVAGPGGRMDRGALITARTPYSRTLQRCVRVLSERRWESLMQCRDLLDTQLWGPTEEDTRRAALISTADSREMAFRLWLATARARTLSTLVLEDEEISLELTNRVRFLTTASPDSLMQVMKLLLL